MNVQKIIAIILIVVGALGLAYGGFSYTKDSHKAEIGAMHFSILEKEQVYIPVWVGVVLIMAGGFLLVTRKKI